MEFFMRFQILPDKKYAKSKILRNILSVHEKTFQKCYTIHQ